jgi:serine protease AprX
MKTSHHVLSIAVVAAATACGGANESDSSGASTPSSEDVNLTGDEEQLRQEALATIARLEAPPEPEGTVYAMEFKNGKVSRSFELAAAYESVAGLDGDDVRVRALQVPVESAAVPVDKLSPALRAALDVAPPRARVLQGTGESFQDVVVTFVEDTRIPRFPRNGRGAARRTAALQTQRQQLGAAVARLREPGYDRRGRELSSRHRAVEKERFWLINAVSLRVPASEVLAIAARSDVQYVELEQGGEPPPVDDIVDGRAWIRSDGYFQFDGGLMALLDTGVRSTHRVFSSPDNLGLLRDCMNGTSNNCESGTSLDPSDHCDHGTGSASILTGSAALGAQSRGVSSILVDSYKVYSAECGYNVAAGVRAFQAAVVNVSNTIVAEIQNNTSPAGSTSTAADRAFDAGSAVIAAAGNFGPTASSVRAPGNAHKAIAVGAFDVVSGDLGSFSGRGPTSDGRLKPELIAPTNTVAASSTSNTAMLPFSGTSGATPYVGAAAGMVNDRFDTATAGHVYAFLIAAGGDDASCLNTTGCGILRMPVGGQSFMGRVDVASGATVDVPVTIGLPAREVRGAIWWPESGAAHQNIDLRLIRPNGNIANSSTATNHVSEKVETTTGLVSGTWRLRITAPGMAQSQTVYWSLQRE